MQKPSSTELSSAKKQLADAQGEVSRLESELRKLSAQREDIIANSADDDDDTAVDVARLSAKLDLLARRLDKARQNEAEAQQALSEQAFDLADRTIDWLSKKEEARFLDFCATFAPFFDKGLNSVAIAGSPHQLKQNAWIRGVWSATDAFSNSRRLRIAISGATRHHSAGKPLAARLAVLESVLKEL